ncbi:NAD(P)/FAD-dependent oxidoreductase [Streptomyces laculatispora]|uniref:NAD(P)/FAD-dependent oxidoreductase n=1 Tax=Streptomyces laculatispora TaxID=887464 RepID=UPI001A94FCF4|nr:FAD-dependent oxidoreductase [Streptomyces laculatispora]MBO0914542.1 FAD-dependent oxidoreductase [Streptomyces laculatispora]
MTGEPRGGRIVVVGASLAGLRAAETLRAKGFAGELTIVGDEPRPPYDRPPLSKQVLLGRVRAQDVGLPRRRAVDARWRLGVSATGLDPSVKRVLLADGDRLRYDRLLIATGTRARPWPHPEQAALDGVLTLRTVDDAIRLADRLDAGPRRVLVIGAGFTGSEIASACRERGLEVTVVERGPAPLVGALGGRLGALAADAQRAHGVDLRCGVTVSELRGTDGRLTGAELSDGSRIDADVAVVALGAVRNTEWLTGSGLAAGPRGVACDAGCRAFDMYGIVTDDIFVAGDVARFPHPLFEYQMISLEHWGNAVAQAEVAAHNMVSAGPDRRPHLTVPAFWSSQFGLNIKSVGVPTFSDQVMIAQGSPQEGRLVAVYGYRGRVTAAVSVNRAKWLEHYRHLIESGAPFPPRPGAADGPPAPVPVPSDVPDPAALSHGPTVALTGHLPDLRLAVVHRGGPVDQHPHDQEHP